MNCQEIFLRFLTENGLLPAQIIRFFYSYSEKKPDIRFIANMLYSQDEFGTSVPDVPKDLLEILSNKPFAADSALSNWLKDASKILEILKTEEIYDNITIPEEQKKWALIAFIKSCPLVGQKTKESYIAQIEKASANNLNNKIYSIDKQENRDKFKAYMMHKNFKPTTITLYTSAINQISRKYCENLWTVTDAASLDNILQNLYNTQSFCNEDKQKIHCLKAALNQYRSFLANKTDKRGNTTNYSNNLVGFCFSCGYQPLFPELNQTEALGEAAKKLKIPFNTLKNIMSYFDYYMADSGRQGWPAASEKMKNNHKDILDKYAINIQGKYYKDAKKLATAYNEAKEILKLN